MIAALAPHAIKYAAFFRNVNLGRPNKPTKALLEAAFAQTGATFVESFLGTGNVVFAAASTAAARAMVAQARATLEAECGLREPACLREVAALASMLQDAPFAHVERDDVHEYCISFMAAKPAALPPLPLCSARGDLQIFRFSGSEAFGFTRLVGGRPGNVNGLLERRLEVPLTTRNWNTVRRIVERHA